LYGLRHVYMDVVFYFTVDFRILRAKLA